MIVLSVFGAMPTEVPFTRIALSAMDWRRISGSDNHEGYLAPCALVQFFYNLLGSRIERVLDVKYVNFCHAV